MTSRARYDRFLAAMVTAYYQAGMEPCWNDRNVACALRSIAEAAADEGDSGVAVGAAMLATAYRLAACETLH